MSCPKHALTFLIFILILILMTLCFLLVFNPSTKLKTDDEKVKEHEPETYRMENRSDITLFEPNRRVSIILSEDGTYHLAFSITLNCHIMNQKEISITHEMKNPEKPEILMQKKICGPYKSSCFEQKLFLAKQYDRIDLNSECQLNEYAGNFLMLMYVPDI